MDSTWRRQPNYSVPKAECSPMTNFSTRSKASWILCFSEHQNDNLYFIYSQVDLEWEWEVLVLSWKRGCCICSPSPGPGNLRRIQKWLSIGDHPFLKSKSTEVIRRASNFSYLSKKMALASPFPAIMQPFGSLL